MIFNINDYQRPYRSGDWIRLTEEIRIELGVIPVTLLGVLELQSPDGIWEVSFDLNGTEVRVDLEASDFSLVPSGEKSEGRILPFHRVG